MKLLRKGSVFFLSLLILSSAAVAKKNHHHAQLQAVYGSQRLTTEIDRIISQAEHNTSIGIQIKSMKSSETLYSHNAHQLFTPASILKILTAEAALAYLGPEYKFTTKVLTNATSTTHGMLNGDLYLVHSGDPSLTYTDMIDLMTALKAEQILGVNGNVYVDNTAYDQDNVGPGWLTKDRQYCYAAPINASIINHNCISFGIAPAKTSGNLAMVLESPRYFYAGFINSARTKSASPRYCHLAVNSQPDNKITLEGCIPRGHIRGASLVIADIIKYNETLLQRLLQQFGIQVAGIVGAKAAATNLSELASHQSKPLSILVTEMLKKSDNIIAGSLFKKLGSLYTRQPGSWSNGSQAVKQILSEKASMNPAEMQLVDGSGLSQENRVTPAQMMQALDFAFHNYSTNYEFISALPIAGRDGTLKYRLQNVAGKVRAKTGTINGVVSLAGYAMSKDNEPIAFVIIINGLHGNIWQYRQIEDRIVTALTNYTSR